MNINLTFLGELIGFILFVFITMRYIWPPILKVLHERQEKIRISIEQAQEAEKTLQQANADAREIIIIARAQAEKIYQNALNKSNDIFKQAEKDAQVKADRIVQHAQTTIQSEYARAREELLREIAGLVLFVCTKVFEEQRDNHHDHVLIENILSKHLKL